jgi:hypothetical protein
LLVILSERGPRRFSAWGGESKDLLLFFNFERPTEAGAPVRKSTPNSASGQSTKEGWRSHNSENFLELESAVRRFHVGLKNI